MIVDDVRREPAGEDAVELSARLRWEGGEDRLRLRAPAALAVGPDDGSPWLAATLLLALRRAEDLELEAPVSPALLARVEHIQGVYTSWNPWLRPVAVRAQEGPAPVPGGDMVAAFFSRGVDSSYTAVAPRPGLPALTHLLFVDGVDLRHDAEVRAEEFRRAGESAEAAGLPLLLTATNLRELSEPLCDWEDMAGAGLAFVGLALAAGLSRAVIPSSDSAMGVSAAGTSSTLDPLFSTEAVTVEHEAPWRTRVAKIAWLAENRPEMLRRLKVCFAENRPDNCGRCGKCLLTLAGLMAAGALDRAEDFPDRMPDDVKREGAPMTLWSIRNEIAEGARLLSPEGEQGRVREELLLSLSRAGSWPDPRSEPVWATTFRAHQGRAIFSLVRDRVPYPGVEGEVPSPRPEGWSLRPGIVRVLDPLAGRHVYGIGTAPPGRPVAELGTLSPKALPDSTPVWVDSFGRLVTEADPPPPRASATARARWLLAPLGWRGVPGRARNLAWRARHLTGPPAPAPSRPEGSPAGWLFPDEDERRRPLYASVHPVTGDQLLSNAEWEGSDMGYMGTRFLGWLEPVDGVTGGVSAPRPEVPWASRLGRGARV